MNSLEYKVVWELENWKKTEVKIKNFSKEKRKIKYYYKGNEISNDIKTKRN